MNRCFETQGIKTVRELVEMTPEELLCVRSFGERSLSQVRTALTDYFNASGRKSTTNRWAYLMDLYATHHSYEAVGRQLGVSRQRVQQGRIHNKKTKRLLSTCLLLGRLSPDSIRNRLS